MRQHESDILLNVDLQFKHMRTDNVYDLLLECQGPNARREFTSRIIGGVVLTYYNNKTYKIDDVDFQSTPASTFKMKDGTEITYKDYFDRVFTIHRKRPNAFLFFVFSFLEIQRPDPRKRSAVVGFSQ